MNRPTHVNVARRQAKAGSDGGTCNYCYSPERIIGHAYCQDCVEWIDRYDIDVDWEQQLVLVRTGGDCG